MSSEMSVWSGERTFYFSKGYPDKHSNFCMKTLGGPILLTLNDRPIHLKHLLNGEIISFYYNDYLYSGAFKYTARLTIPEDKLSKLDGEKGESVASRIEKMVIGKQLLFRLDDPQMGSYGLGGVKNYTVSLGMSDASMGDLETKHREIVTEDLFFIEDVDL